MTVFERSYPHNPLLRHQKSEGSLVSRDDMSFYSARERQESTVDEEKFRLTLDTAETRGSDVSAIGESYLLILRLAAHGTYGMED